MNVLQVLPALNSGGVERGTIEVAKYLYEHGHNAFVVSSGGYREEQLSGIATHITLPVNKKNPLTVFYCARKLAGIIEQNQVHIVHARSRVPAWISYLAVKTVNKRRLMKKGLSVPLVRFVTTCHGKYSKSWFSSIMARGHRVIVPSRFILDYMAESFSLDEKKSELVYRGVDLSEFKFRPPRECPSNPYVIALLGRITPKKGHMLAVDVLSGILKKGLSCELWFIGEASKGKESFSEKLKDYIRQVGLQRKVRFLGAVEDVSERLKGVSVLLAPSQYDESFGRMVIEAGACGIPVVASDRPAFNEIIAHMKTGLLVESSSVNKFVGAVIGLLENQALYRSIAINARHQVESKFSLDVMCDKTLRVYLSEYQKKTIGVIKYSALGDIILSMASLSGLRYSLPTAEVLFITGEAGKEVVPPGLADAIFDWNGNILNMAKRINSYNVDVLLDLQNKVKTHLLGRFVNAVSCGFNLKAGFLLDRPVKHNPSLPLLEQKELFLSLGLKWPEDMRFSITDKESVKRVKERLFAMGWKDSDRLCVFNISASAKWKSKNLSTEDMAVIIKGLVSRGHSVVLCGGALAERRADAIMNTLKGSEVKLDAVHNFVGKTTIKELIALISIANCLITPDSGPMHIAALVNTRCVVYFGPTDSKRHLPFVSEKISPIEKELPCRPCYKPVCPKGFNECLSGLSGEILKKCVLKG